MFIHLSNDSICVVLNNFWHVYIVYICASSHGFMGTNAHMHMCIQRSKVDVDTFLDYSHFIEARFLADSSSSMLASLPLGPLFSTTQMMGL